MTTLTIDELGRMDGITLSAKSNDRARDSLESKVDEGTENTIQKKGGVMQAFSDAASSTYGKLATVIGALGLTYLVNTADISYRNGNVNIGVSRAVAEECLKEISVQEYYNRGSPVTQYGIEGLKVMPFYGKGGCGDRTKISTSARDKPDNYNNGKFTNYFFGEKYGESIKKIFNQHGIDSGKIENFFANHKNEKRLSFYHDGYMLLFDKNEQKTYILPVKPQLIKDLSNL